MIFSAPDVEEQPTAVLTNWRIVEAMDDDGNRTRHFVGIDNDFGGGRASTAIVSFDKDALIGRTKSGRVYGLQGSPSSNQFDDAAYVWNSFAYINRLKTVANVTDEMLNA